MPTHDAALGFSNHWYPLALETAVPITLPRGEVVRVISGPLFVATKLVAFAARGRNEYAFSSDLEDVIAVIDGRAELLQECERSPGDLRAFLSDRISELLGIRAFIEALPLHLPGDQGSQARLPDLRRKIEELAGLHSAEA